MNLITENATKENLSKLKLEITKSTTNLVLSASANKIEFLDVFIQLKMLEESAKKAMELLKVEIVEQAKKYDNSFNWKGFTIEQRKGSETFDFSNCPEITCKEEELKALKETYKKTYKNYKEGLITISGNSTWFNPITEKRNPLPLIKKGEDTVILKSNKKEVK